MPSFLSRLRRAWMEAVGDRRDAVGDELEIRDLINRYADAATRRDARGVAETFAADGEWSAEGIGRARGPEEMVPLFARLQAGFTGFLHSLLSGRVRLDPADPNRASGRWYMLEMGTLADGTEISVWGVYHDVYLRDAGAWRISRRRFDPLFTRSGQGFSVSPFPTDLADGE